MKILLFLHILALVRTIEAAFNINNLKSELLLRNFINLRTGNKCNRNGIWWHYTGIIRNPLSGKEIIAVEGIENIRLIDTSWFPFKGIRNKIFKNRIYNIMHIQYKVLRTILDYFFTNFIFCIKANILLPSYHLPSLFFISLSYLCGNLCAN